MSIVSAYGTMSPTSPLVRMDITRREPGPHDVVIDIAFAGICHSDIHTARGEWDGVSYPVVPGHEITGVVAAVGSSVSTYTIGDRVGVGVLVNSCQKCSECHQHLEQYCPDSVWTYNSLDYDGTITYGGYSGSIVVNENFVLRIPDSIPLDKAAPLLCAGITLYSPLRHWNVGPGKKIAILGLGGLGHMGVQLAAAMGAEVTVLSRSLKKKDDGLRLGAHDYYATDDPETFKRLAGHFDLIINTVSANLDLGLYLNALARDGVFIELGLPEHDIAVPPFPLAGMRRSIAGSMVGGIAETQEMLHFCAEHQISAEIELIQPDYINTAYERAIAGDVRYRFVIDTASLAS